MRRPRRAALLGLGLLLALGAFACVRVQRRPGPGTAARALTWAGRERTYLLHVPPALPPGPLPLVVVLHGGGGRGAQMEGFTGFSALADREGFLVAYPDGVDRSWYDGREGDFSTAHRERLDDAGFIAAMISEIAAARPVDPDRVYATGISNGGFFSHHLAATDAPRFAAIAPIVGGLAEPLARRFAPAAPVSVLIIQGTEDPLVPYGGGEVRLVRGGAPRGRLVPTEEAARRWARADGCAEPPTAGTLLDAAPDDGCRVEWTRWSGGRGGAEVLLHRVVGGGHTWPGGAQYLPEALVGRVCRDLDATTAIWRFFQAHPRARPAPP